jgi:hypothetical protein
VSLVESQTRIINSPDATSLGPKQGYGNGTTGHPGGREATIRNRGKEVPQKKADCRTMTGGCWPGS